MKRLHNLAQNVTVPKEFWEEGMDGKEQLAYITKEEKKLLKLADIHNMGTANKKFIGPGGVERYPPSHGGGNPGSDGAPGGDTGNNPGKNDHGNKKGKSTANNPGRNDHGNKKGKSTANNPGRMSHGTMTSKTDKDEGKISQLATLAMDTLTNPFTDPKSRLNDFFGDGFLGKAADIAFGTDDIGMDNAIAAAKSAFGTADKSDSTSTPSPIGNPSTDRSNNNDPNDRGGGNGGRNTPWDLQTLASLITNPTQSMTNVPPEDGDGSSMDDVFAMPMTDLITKRYRRLATLRHKNKEKA